MGTNKQKDRLIKILEDNPIPKHLLISRSKFLDLWLDVWKIVYPGRGELKEG